MSKKIFAFLLALLICLSPQVALAQTQADAPVYVVQSGDTLYSIALRFGLTVDDLVKANQLVDPNQLNAGMELAIPGLEGISGKLLTETIPLGVDLASLTRYRGLNSSLMIKLNRITRPAEVYAGSDLIIPQSENPIYRKPVQVLAPNQSNLELAASLNTNPWEVILANQETGSSYLTAGEQLFAYSSEETPAPNPLSPLVTKITIDPAPLVQGKTEIIRVTTQSTAVLEGQFNGFPLHFFPDGENQFVALQGIHAMAEPGLAPFSLRVTDSAGVTRGFDQMMLLQQGYYAQDPPLTVDPATLDKANTQPEDDLIRKTTAPVTQEKYWNGIWHLPVDEPFCIKSWYGNRRSYNGGPYTYFHTGLDYGVCASLNILAPAPGIVVFSGPLTVRGNATIIDHGWGVYSGIWHQEESKVKVGDRVETGQVIGVIGGTGRVTGPHLHWEVWVNGIQVEPQDWLDRAFP
jgi:murein DD-endopeptidase MepM/ murein hydrolase activator NlpD